MIEYLSIDLETKSGTDLSKSGVYRYVEDDDFEILLFGYSINGGEVSVVDMACGEQIPEDVLRAIADENVVKWVLTRPLSASVFQPGCESTALTFLPATASRKTVWAITSTLCPGGAL